MHNRLCTNTQNTASATLYASTTLIRSSAADLAADAAHALGSLGQSNPMVQAALNMLHLGDLANTGNHGADASKPSTRHATAHQTASTLDHATDAASQHDSQSDDTAAHD